MKVARGLFGASVYMRASRALLIIGLLWSPLVAQPQDSAGGQDEFGNVPDLSDVLFIHFLTLNSFHGDHAVMFARQTFGLSEDEAHSLIAFAADAVSRYQELGKVHNEEVCQLSASPTVRDQIISKIEDLREAEKSLREAFSVELENALSEESISGLIRYTEQMKSSVVIESFELDVLRDPSIDLYEISRRPCL